MKNRILLVCSALLAGTSISLSGCLGPTCNSLRCNNLEPRSCNDSYANTHWLQRAQGEQLGIFAGAGVCDKINLFCPGRTYGVLAFTAQYERNFNSGDVSSYFGGINSGLITIGNPTNNSSNFDIRATDMGLADQGYNGTFCVKPLIRNVVINTDLFVGWDGIARGLYTRVRAPLTFSKWDIRLNQAYQKAPLLQKPLDANIFTPASAVQPPFLPQGSLDTYTIDGNAAYTLPLYDAADSFDGTVLSNGLPVPTTYYVDGTLQYQASQFPQLIHGVLWGALYDVGFADLPMDIGYNIMQRERGMLGLAFHAVAPIGTRQDDDCIFSPRIGYGRWQLGGQVNAQYTLCQTDEYRLNLYLAGFVTYALATTENRLLGLRAGDSYEFNHYLLLKKFNDAGDLIALERAANLLYQPINLSGFINSDVAVWGQYQHGPYDVTVGYNFVGRQAEGFINTQGKTVREKCLDAVEHAVFGNSAAYYVIKGDSLMYNNANNPDLTFYEKANSNIRVLGTQNTSLDIAEIKAGAFTPDDVIGAPAIHPRMISHSLFGYLGYNWEQQHHVAPFVGIGGHVEGGPSNAVMNMWSFFVKGGFAF